tara:strand:+ start:2191 stop:2733 length:543 start_codon:yes stop_codon:yes gene_type:complete
MMFASLSTGCLVTDPIPEPEQEINYPPSVVADRSAPEGTASLESVSILDRSDPEVGSITFHAIIRDPNVDQALRYQIWVDYADGMPPLPEDFGDIPPTSTRDFERPFSFTIDALGSFDAPNCHKVELRVSSAFRGDIPTPDGIRQPDEEGDLGVGVFFVDAQLDTGGGLATSCNPGGTNE